MHEPQHRAAPPRLSADGEALLRDVLARHERTRWDDREPDGLPAAHDIDHQTLTTSGRRGAPGVVFAAAIVVLVGLSIAIFGVLAGGAPGEGTASNATESSPMEDDAEIAVEVLEASIEGAAPPTDALRAADHAPMPTTEAEGPEDVVATASAATHVVEVSIAVYAAQEAITTFAIRVSNDGADVVPTDAFTVEVVQNGRTISTTTHFEHDDMPGGSSAIATVRTSEAIDESATVLLLHDGREIARQPLA